MDRVGELERLLNEGMDLRRRAWWQMVVWPSADHIDLYRQVRVKTDKLAEIIADIRAGERFRPTVP